jgi:hypothetical protein
MRRAPVSVSTTSVSVYEGRSATEWISHGIIG